MEQLANGAGGISDALSDLRLTPADDGGASMFLEHQQRANVSSFLHDAQGWIPIREVPPSLIDLNNLLIKQEYERDQTMKDEDDTFLPGFDKYQKNQTDGEWKYRINPDWLLRYVLSRGDEANAVITKEARSGLQKGQQLEDAKLPKRCSIVAVAHPNPPVLFKGLTGIGEDGRTIDLSVRPFPSGLKSLRFDRSSGRPTDITQPPARVPIDPSQSNALGAFDEANRRVQMVQLAGSHIKPEEMQWCRENRVRPVDFERYNMKERYSILYEQPYMNALKNFNSGKIIDKDTGEKAPDPGPKKSPREYFKIDEDRMYLWKANVPFLTIDERITERQNADDSELFERLTLEEAQRKKELHRQAIEMGGYMKQVGGGRLVKRSLAADAVYLRQAQEKYAKTWTRRGQAGQFEGTEEEIVARLKEAEGERQRRWLDDDDFDDEVEKQRAKIRKAHGVAAATDEAAVKAAVNARAQSAETTMATGEDAETLRDMSYRAWGNFRNYSGSMPETSGTDEPLLSPTDFPDGTDLSAPPWRHRPPHNSRNVDLDVPEVLNYENENSNVEVVWFATLQDEAMKQFRHKTFLDPETNVLELDRLNRTYYAKKYGGEGAVPPVLNMAMLVEINSKLQDLSYEERESSFLQYEQELETYKTEFEEPYGADIDRWSTYVTWWMKKEDHKVKFEVALLEYQAWYRRLTETNDDDEKLYELPVNRERSNYPLTTADGVRLGIGNPRQWKKLTDVTVIAPNLDDLRYQPPDGFEDGARAVPMYPEFPMPDGMAQSPMFSGPDDPGRLRGLPRIMTKPTVPPNTILRIGKPMSMWARGAPDALIHPDYQWPMIRTLKKNGLLDLPGVNWYKANKHKLAFVLHYALYPAGDVRAARQNDTDELKKQYDKLGVDVADASKNRRGVMIRQAQEKRLADDAEKARQEQQGEENRVLQEQQNAARAAAEVEAANADRLRGRQRALLQFREVNLQPTTAMPPDEAWAQYVADPGRGVPPDPGSLNAFFRTSGASGERYEEEDAYNVRLGAWKEKVAEARQELGDANHIPLECQPWEPTRGEASYYRYAEWDSANNPEARRSNTRPIVDAMGIDDSLAPVGARPEESMDAYRQRKLEYQRKLREAKAARNVDQQQTEAQSQAQALARRREMLDAGRRARRNREAARQEVNVTRNRSRDAVSAAPSTSRIDNALALAKQPVGEIDLKRIDALANLSLEDVGVFMLGADQAERTRVFGIAGQQGAQAQDALRVLVAREIARRQQQSDP